DLFSSEYLQQDQPWKLVRHRITGDPKAANGQQFMIEVELEENGTVHNLVGRGDGAISAFVNALDMNIRIMDYHEHAIGTGTDTRAASYVELRVGESPTGFGVGIHGDIVTASFLAILSAVNRHAATQAAEKEMVAA